MMHINWKKTLIVTLDIVLAVYLGLAMTSFNKPDETAKLCTKVSIIIADENTNGFLSAKEIKKILEKKKLYPLEKHMQSINPRDIEEVLKTSSFVNTVQCYKTQNGHVCINVTQRLPVVRIMSVKGDDYYLDDEGGIMPNSKYTSDLIIATGYITKDFARHYLASLTDVLMSNEFWKNQIVQINILPDLGVELVPRVGEHIIFIGYLPQTKDEGMRKQLITDYLTKKLERLDKFYRYGLSAAGWNKYHYISMEFDNQIICKKTVKAMPAYTPPAVKTEEKKDSTAVSTEKKDSIKQDNNKKSV
jgi:cell division protein FtsQ